MAMLPPAMCAFFSAVGRGVCLCLLLAVVPALSQNNSDYAAQRRAAFQLEQQGKLEDAAAAWRKISQARPADAEPYAHLGLIAAREENYTQAAQLDRRALRLNPRLPGIRLNLGLALFKAGDLQAAIPEFAQLLKAAPPQSDQAQRLSILLGMSYYGVGQFAQAAPLLREAARRDPQNLPLRMALAHSCLWSKQYQCVLDTYHEILMLNAESAEADMLAGEALDELQDKAGAVAQFRAAEKVNPKEPEVHFGLGYLLWSQRQYDEAEREFKLELANDPAHAQSMLYLGDLYMQSNKPEQAEPLLRKAIALDPSLWRAHLDLGILNADAKRNSEAIDELKTAAKLNPDDVNIHWRLGRVYRAMGSTDAARVEFDRASKLNKAADETLFRKMSSGKGGQTATVPAAPNQ
jgi:tetratricopeptide (TPR) repeat protein